MNEQITAFFEDRIIARGLRDDVTRAVEQGWPNDQGVVRAFEDATGRTVDLDLWDAHRRADAQRPPAPAPARGRPRLGVTAREVTLLPRQWDWLGLQPGGASATIRRLVDQAQKTPPGRKAAREAIHHFLTAMAGDRPGYEAALRALYRGESGRFREIIADWPADVRAYVEDWLKAAT
ncbi:MAG: DUF2239 family protein [Allosphingosinicella sp.]